MSYFYPFIQYLKCCGRFVVIPLHFFPHCKSYKLGLGTNTIGYTQYITVQCSSESYWWFNDFCQKNEPFLPSFSPSSFFFLIVFTSQRYQLHRRGFYACFQTSWARTALAEDARNFSDWTYCTQTYVRIFRKFVTRMLVRRGLAWMMMMPSYIHLVLVK